MTFRDEWENLKQAVAGSTSNVVGIHGSPVIDRRIGDMKSGEVGYTVPWAVQDGNLNEDFSVHREHGGTVQLKVRCTLSGHAYEIEYPTNAQGGE